MSAYDVAALRQLREGVAASIAESPFIIEPSRDGVLQPRARVRLQHESGSIQKDNVGPAGLDTNLSLYVKTDHLAPLLEGDTFDALGSTWVVGPVNPTYKFGGLVKTEAPLTRATVVPVTVPEYLTAEEVGASEIDLAWEDVGDVNTYSVERKTGTGSFAVIGTAAAGALTYSDTGLAAETTYVYRIRAYDGAAYSAYTAEASATTEAT